MDALTNLLQSFADLVRPAIEFLIWIFPFKVYRLHDGERGVIKTFGRVYDWRIPEKGPGFWFCFMFEEMDVIQAKGGFIDISPQHLITKDKKLIIINSAIVYSIESVRLSVLETEGIEFLLSGLLMNKIREHARDHILDDLVDSEKLTKDLSQSLKSKAKKCGVRIEEIMITDLYPQEVIYACDVIEKSVNKLLDRNNHENCACKQNTN